MNSVINFLISHYFVFAILVFFLILAIIGYIFEDIRMTKLKKEFMEITRNEAFPNELSFDKAIEKIKKKR